MQSALLIKKVDLTKLEKQRQTLQSLLSGLRSSDFTSEEDDEHLYGLGEMLNHWSDARYYKDTKNVPIPEEQVIKCAWADLNGILTAHEAGDYSLFDFSGVKDTLVELEELFPEILDVGAAADIPLEKVCENRTPEEVVRILVKREDPFGDLMSLVESNAVMGETSYASELLMVYSAAHGPLERKAVSGENAVFQETNQTPDEPSN